MNKKNILCLISIIVIFLSIYAYIYLPENVITQISFSGELRKSPKIIAILIPLSITIIGAFLFLKLNKNKYFNLSIIGFLILVLNILFNLKF